MTVNNSTILRTENLNAWYGQQQILRDINFYAKRGELICIIGPNGSGKSTLLGILSGIERTDLRAKGDIFVNEKNITSLKRKDIALNVSYMTQTEFSVWNYTVRDIILSGRYAHTTWSNWYNQHDRDLVEEAMSELDILHLADRPIHSLSGGEAQRARIARCLVQESPLLLLDEPVANLDFGIQHMILKKLREVAHEKNVGIAVAIHDLNVAASFADRIVLLHPVSNVEQKESQLITGSVNEVFTPEVLSKVYNDKFEVFKHPVFECPQVYVAT